MRRERNPAGPNLRDMSSYRASNCLFPKHFPNAPEFSGFDILNTGGIFLGTQQEAPTNLNEFN